MPQFAATRRRSACFGFTFGPKTIRHVVCLYKQSMSQTQRYSVNNHINQGKKEIITFIYGETTECLGF